MAATATAAAIAEANGQRPHRSAVCDPAVRVERSKRQKPLDRRPAGTPRTPGSRQVCGQLF
jgi:hypothetical protein